MFCWLLLVGEHLVSAVEVIRTGTRPDGRELDSIMPWEYFGDMTDMELGALWAYLQSQPALEDRIAKQ